MFSVTLVKMSDQSDEDENILQFRNNSSNVALHVQSPGLTVIFAQHLLYGQTFEFRTSNI